MISYVSVRDLILSPFILHTVIVNTITIAYTRTCAAYRDEMGSYGLGRKQILEPHVSIDEHVYGGLQDVLSAKTVALHLVPVGCTRASIRDRYWHAIA